MLKMLAGTCISVFVNESFRQPTRGRKRSGGKGMDHLTVANAWFLPKKTKKHLTHSWIVAC